MKNKNGFTLIELIGVIVLLTIIALIAIPTIMNLINEGIKKSFVSSAYGIIKAGELYYQKQEMIGEELNNVAFEFPDNASGLDVDGKMPNDGKLVVRLDGNIGLAITNGKYCVTKGYDEQDISIFEEFSECEIPSILSSDNGCIKDGNTVCPNATQVNVQVNDSKNYTFYVIGDTGKELTLIMDRNFTSESVWVSERDHGNDDYGEWGQNYKGPIALLNKLEPLTNDWVNVPIGKYEVNDDGGGDRYETIIKNMRARLLTYTEAIQLECNEESCPEYLYGNLYQGGGISTNSYGYWLSAANSSKNAYFVRWTGKLESTNVIFLRGIRPVISVSKYS